MSSSGRNNEERQQREADNGAPAERGQRSIGDIFRRRRRRDDPTPAESSTDEQGEAEQRRQRRSRETDEQRARHLQTDADRHRAQYHTTNVDVRRQQARQRYSVRFGSAACRRRHVDANGYAWGCASRFADHWPKYQRIGVIGRKANGQPNVCRFCGALLFDGEKSNECCMYGKVHHEPLPQSPPLIQHLCDPTNTSGEAKNFRDNINAYNVALSFGTLSTHTHTPGGRGPPVMLINGQQSQQIGQLRPGLSSRGERRIPLFGQVYVIDDVEEAVNTRMRMPITRNLLPNLMQRLEAMIRHLNPYARQLIPLSRQLAMAEEQGEPVERYRLSILDHRPAPGQVCVLFDVADNDPPDASLNGIWLMAEGNELKTIGIWNKNADWILFPLMFPRATQTYGLGIPRNSRRGASAEQQHITGEGVLDDIANEVAPPQTETPVEEIASPVQHIVDTAETNLPTHDTQVPAVEPANWAEPDEVDWEIPADMVDEQPAVIDAEDGGGGGGANAVTNRFAGMENVLRDTAPGLATRELAIVQENDLEYLFDAQVFALMRYFAMNSDRRVVVVSSEYTSMLNQFPEFDFMRVDLAQNYGEGDIPMSFDDNRDMSAQPELIIIPVVLTRHFAVAIYDPAENVMHYFDSLNWRLQARMSDALVHAVVSLNAFRPDGLVIQAHHTNDRLFTRQTDGYTCGVHAARNVELWLFNNRQLYTPHVNMAEERRRFVGILTQLSRQPTIPRYESPYSSAIRRPIESNAASNSRQPPSQQLDTTRIGDYVPYNAEAFIPDANVANDQPAADIRDGDAETEAEAEPPFIAEGRADESMSSYRARAEGPAKFASRRDYWVYHMQRRNSYAAHHSIMSFGRLTQKFLIHQAWLIFFNEEEHQRRLQNTPRFRRALRPDFINYHQQRLQQHRADDENVEELRIGRVYQMPSSSRQSSKNIHINITRSMAIRKAVNPKAGFFITYTFNCKCPEIVEMIGAHANPADYPDLCCRLAAAKFKQLLNYVVGPKGIFGSVKAFVWSLEYQKRNNKHWHLVLMLDPAEGVDANSPEFVDQYITAKIPDVPSEDDPDYVQKMHYYRLVISFYIHDCEDNEQAACRVDQHDRACRFGFPQQYADVTTISANRSSVTYARPSREHGGNWFWKEYAGGRRKRMTNANVVPHNPVLTLLMGSHTCVEFITEYSMWFYVFKYSYKPDSRVMSALYQQDPQEPNVYNADEFNVRRELAFYGPFEAVDILRSEPWAGRSHDPLMLSVHLEGEEPVYFLAGHEEAAERRVNNPEYRSKWTAYMKLCREEPAARRLLFEEVERDYTFHVKEGREYVWVFKERLRDPRGGLHIGMIYPPNPKKPELFATYLLALELRGIQSFEDLRTLNRPNDENYDATQPSVRCANAIEAAVRRGLLLDDHRWRCVMEEAAVTIHNSQLFVNFFVTLLLFSRPADPRTLFDDYMERLMAPRRRDRANDLQIRKQQLLRRIQRLLEEANCTMAEFGLPEPEPDNRSMDERVADELIPPVQDPVTGEPIEVDAETRGNLALDSYNNCNTGQRYFLDLVRDRLLQLANTRRQRQQPTNLILLKGEGGTGKTHALNVLIELCHAQGVPIRVCASTGIAATRLFGGTTAHQLFGIPVDRGNAPRTDIKFSSVTPTSFRGNVLRRIAVFVIDEVGMLHVDDLYCINMLLKDLHRNAFRYGRVLMVFTGDERQLMPIVRGVDPLGEQQAAASFFFSSDMQHCEIVELTENRRLQQGQGHFLAWQRNIGIDRYRHVVFPDDAHREFTRYICLPGHFVRYNEEEFVREIFNEEFLAGNPLLLTQRVILSPVNEVVDRLNAEITRMMPADRASFTYIATNVADAYDVYDPMNAIFAQSNLNSINPPDLPQHRLTLTVGMPVMCMQNLDVPNGICNGTVMAVERLDEHIVWCRVNTRFGQRLYPIAPTRFIYSNLNFKFTRVQLPLRVAFAATINRAQGGTYDHVAYHSLHPIWAHGMLYTAVTRVTNAAGLTILCNPDRNYVHNGMVLGTTRNVVHSRVSHRTDTVTLPGGAGSDRHHPGDAPSSPNVPVISEADMDFGPEFQFYDPHWGSEHDNGRQAASAPAPSWSSVSGSAHVGTGGRTPSADRFRPYDEHRAHAFIEEMFNKYHNVSVQEVEEAITALEQRPIMESEERKAFRAHVRETRETLAERWSEHLELRYRYAEANRKLEWIRSAGTEPYPEAEYEAAIYQMKDAESPLKGSPSGVLSTVPTTNPPSIIENLLTSLSLKNFEERREATRLEQRSHGSMDAAFVNPKTLKEVRRVLVQQRQYLIPETIEYIRKRKQLLG